MNIYNKKIGGKNGTLIANWQEEYALRDFTGEGRYSYYFFTIIRTKPKEHIPKKWGDLENPIVHNKVFDNSHNRIHGEKQYQTFETFNHTYGGAKNPVDSMPKIGRRDEILERNVIKI